MIQHFEFELIWAHALAEYPFECCGIITGKQGVNGSAKVHKCRNIQNELHSREPEKYPRDARTAYVIEPSDQFSIIREAEKRVETVLAVYHSHPENGAYFSERDRELAFFMGEPVFPDAAYIVVSVMNRVVKESVSYKWDQERDDFNKVLLFENCD